ncbi:hypothetical protein J7I44_08150 [Frateuria sp. MAH-13]|uniref:Uncharacterized protein n=1 Tax=Frateuria flava TaxID=2821489 RepID=A0ABS4DMJ0_9GAMM|nr:hypothetical protein [Frateuria flava]MBP1474268.1 hypothetical protein [Frateuria flava]
MRLTHVPSTLLLALATAFAPPVTRAGDTPSAADIAAINSFQLDQDFLDRYMAVQEDAAKNPCHLSMLALLGDEQPRSLDQVASRYDAQPGVHAMFARHGLTGRQALIGMSVLTAAAMQDLEQSHPEMTQYVDTHGSRVSAGNLVFYRAHNARIHQHQQALGKRLLAANGGKLPDCLSH